MAVPAANVSITNQVAEIIVTSAIEGVTFYLGARLFTTIPGPAAAVFGVSATIIGAIVKPIFDYFLCQPGANDASRFLSGTLTLISSGFGAALSTSLITGYTITIGSFCSLFLSAIVAGILVSIVLSCVGYNQQAN